MHRPAQERLEPVAAHEPHRTTVVPAQGVRSVLEFDLFLESTSDDTWIFRRDGRVQRSINELTTTRSGIPIVDPAVQLLYMAKSEEPKNQHDFEVARPTLADEASAEWLRKAPSAWCIPATRGSANSDEPRRTVLNRRPGVASSRVSQTGQVRGASNHYEGRSQSGVGGARSLSLNVGGEGSLLTIELTPQYPTPATWSRPARTRSTNGTGRWRNGQAVWVRLVESPGGALHRELSQRGKQSATPRSGRRRACAVQDEDRQERSGSSGSLNCSAGWCGREADPRAPRIRISENGRPLPGR